ncbi:MAG: TIR domain-containing protein [Acholeplasmatales bacterium]|nr:TIR domain-containing protein [Acholeplasmatales bacterium]
MTDFEKKLMEELLHKVEYYNNDFILEKYNHKEGHKKVYDFLKTIVDYVGCNDYLFVYAVTKLEEKHGKFMLSYLFEILDNYGNYPEFFDDSVAFAAYYNICLHYYRYFQIKDLYNFLTTTPYLSIFKKKYALAFDGIGRYCNMNGMFDRMLIIDYATIRNLEKFKLEKPEMFEKTKHGYIQTGNNVAVKVGIVAATAAIFEQMFIRGLLDTNIKPVDKNHFAIDNIDNMGQAELNKLIDIHDNYQIDTSLINNDTLSIAMKYCQEAIDYNPTYPKYPFLRAQLLFYDAIYNKEVIDFTLLTEIKNLLSKAKSLENVKANDYQLRVSKYSEFQKRVEDYMERSHTVNKVDLEYYRMKDEIIHMQVCPPPQKRMKPSAKANDQYAFISYSTLDFKSVYCDLIAYKKRGINFWYDAGVVAGEAWHKTIEEKIINANVIICYISPGFLRSQAIYRELTLFKKYNKPIIWIDLTGKKQISKIILDVMRTADIELASQIGSNMLNLITELIDDDVDIISRDLDPLSTTHIDRIENVILKKFRPIVKRLESEHLCIKNNKDLNLDVVIPNEDYIINDTLNNIYIVMDGISRKYNEYSSDGNSIAFDVSKLFADTIHDYIEKEMNKVKDYKDAKLLLKEGFKNANSKVDIMLKSRAKEFEGFEYPGSVGVVSFIVNDVLYYASLGDCMIVLTRGEQKIILAKKQTTFVFDILKHEKNRTLLAQQYVNNIDEAYGYGVVNGQENAHHYFTTSYINLNRNDIVYLVSDGISDYIEYNKNEIINNMSLEKIVEESNKQDDIMNKPYYDDKAIIRIKMDVINE